MKKVVVFSLLQTQNIYELETTFDQMTDEWKGSEMKTKRIEYLDFIKAIAIMLVVFCHKVALSDDSVIGNIMMAIAWAAVPNFFFVTGGLMHQSKQLDWRKHIRRILHAYGILCAWKVIYLIFFSAVREVSFSKVELIKYIFLTEQIDNVETNMMWFMYAYITVLIFFPVSYYLFNGGKEGKRILGFAVVVLFVQTYLISAANFILETWSTLTGRNLLKISISSFVPFGGYTNMLFFFICGAFLFQYRENINAWIEEKTWRRWLPVLSFVAGTAGLVFVKFCETGLVSWGGVYIVSGYNRFSTVLTAFGLYFILSRWKIGKVGRFIGRYVGTATMGIYFIHRPILVLFQDVFSHYYEVYGSFGLNVLKTVVAVVICVFATMIVRKIPLVRELVK